MTRLTLEEYRRNHDDAAWPETIATRPDVVEAFMIEFANPSFLCGPFGGSYGLVTIRDARKGPNRLYTETETYNRFRTYTANNLANMPRAKNDNAGLTPVHQYLMGRHRTDTLEPAHMDDHAGTQLFSTRNTLERSATLDHPFLQIFDGTSFEIDGLDMLRLFRRMVESLPKDEVIRRITETETKIEARLESFLAHDADSTPTIEKPFLLTLSGNDDSSWGKVFESLELAMEFAEKLEATSEAGLRQPPGMNPTN
jgi:hypothetical protein